MNQKIGCVSISFSSLLPYLVKLFRRWREKAGATCSGDWVATGNEVPAAASPVLIFSVHIRFDILDQEMKSLMAQIEGVNSAANSLVESGHPRSGEVKKYQDNLNTRWGVGRVGGWGHLLLAHDTPPGMWPRSQDASYALPGLSPQSSCLSQPRSPSDAGAAAARRRDLGGDCPREGERDVFTELQMLCLWWGVGILCERGDILSVPVESGHMVLMPHCPGHS